MYVDDTIDETILESLSESIRNRVGRQIGLLLGIEAVENRYADLAQAFNSPDNGLN